MFEPFAEVPFYPLVFPVFWGAAAFFCLAMARHLRVFAAVRASRPSPFANVPTRLVGLVQYAFVQTKMFKDARAGLMHAGIFWGFVLLTIGTANIVTGGLIQADPLDPVRRPAVGARSARCRTSSRSSSWSRSAGRSGAGSSRSPRA